MVRFKKYINKDLRLENVKNSNQLQAFGIICRHLPDPPEDFDEFEFITDFDMKNNVIIGVAIELGKIKRVMFGLVDKADPDIFRALNEL